MGLDAEAMARLAAAAGASAVSLDELRRAMETLGNSMGPNGNPPQASGLHVCPYGCVLPAREPRDSTFLRVRLAAHLRVEHGYATASADLLADEAVGAWCAGVPLPPPLGQRTPQADARRRGIAIGGLKP